MGSGLLRERTLSEVGGWASSASGLAPVALEEQAGPSTLAQDAVFTAPLWMSVTDHWLCS